MRCRPQGTDIVIVIDDSNSISSTEWKYQTEFVKNYVHAQQLGTGATDTRVAIVFFGDEVKYWDFKKFWALQEKTSDAIYHVFASHRRLHQRTRTERGLERARSFLTKSQYGARLADDGLRRIIMVLTDGQATYQTLLRREIQNFDRLVGRQFCSNDQI